MLDLISSQYNDSCSHLLCYCYRLIRLLFSCLNYFQRLLFTFAIPHPPAERTVLLESQASCTTNPVIILTSIRQTTPLSICDRISFTFPKSEQRQKLPTSLPFRFAFHFPRGHRTTSPPKESVTLSPLHQTSLTVPTNFSLVASDLTSPQTATFWLCSCVSTFAHLLSITPSKCLTLKGILLFFRHLSYHSFYKPTCSTRLRQILLPVLQASYRLYLSFYQ